MRLQEVKNVGRILFWNPEGTFSNFQASSHNLWRHYSLFNHASLHNTLIIPIYIDIKNSVSLVRERTIPIERPPLVVEVSAECRVVSATDFYGRDLGFLDRRLYFFFQVAHQLYSRGWLYPVPDPLLFRKSDRTRHLWICSQELWPLDHRGGYPKHTALQILVSSQWRISRICCLWNDSYFHLTALCPIIYSISCVGDAASWKSYWRKQ
jgi:hypothetical protein